jgi:hypothetical protein
VGIVVFISEGSGAGGRGGRGQPGVEEVRAMEVCSERRGGMGRRGYERETARRTKNRDFREPGKYTQKETTSILFQKVV